jgi:hypothetical protein
MPKFLDGVQETIENIPEFMTLAAGTITVGTNQYPTTPLITRPSKIYKNYILLISNNSGQTIANVHMFGRNIATNSVLPNTGTTQNTYLKTALSISSGAAGARGAVDLTAEEPNPFVMGNSLFQINLAAAPTSGTIDWALIGY